MPKYLHKPVGSSKLLLMPPSLKLTFLLLFVAISISLINPSLSLAGNGGLIFKTGLGTFYIPADRPTKVALFPKNDFNLAKLVSKYTQNADQRYGITIKNFSTQQEFNYNDHEVFPTASLYKIMLMATLYEKARIREIKLDQNLKDRIYNMTTVSSNEDAWYLADRVGWNTVEQTMKKFGLKNTTMGLPPKSTPKDISLFLELLYDKKLVDAKSSNEMYQIMLDQKINDRIPRLLPDEVKVAHKTGELDDVLHNVGVVESQNNTYMIILMSDQNDNPISTGNDMANLSKDVYDYFENQWRNAPSIL